MKNRGFTLVEILIAAAVLILFSLGIYQGFSAVYQALAAAHHKALAIDLINARFEVIKNLPYNSVGVVGGSPSGVVPSTQTVTVDQVSFVITTTIVNADDPFDGISGGGDAFPADYRLIEIQATCVGCRIDPVVITGRISPPDLET